MKVEFIKNSDINIYTYIFSDHVNPKRSTLEKLRDFLSELCDVNLPTPTLYTIQSDCLAAVLRWDELGIEVHYDYDVIEDRIELIWKRTPQ